MELRQSFGKSVICLVQNGTYFPFEIIGERAIFYNNDYADVNLIKENLRNVIDNLGTLIEDKPVTRALQFNSEVNNLIAQGKPGEAFLFEKINSLENKLDNLVNSKYIDEQIITNREINKWKGSSFTVSRNDNSLIIIKELSKNLRFFTCSNSYPISFRIKSASSQSKDAIITADSFLGASVLDAFISFMGLNVFVVLSMR